MQWEQVHVKGYSYSPRTGHAVIAYHDLIYLFGGIDEMDKQNDMYCFNGSSWQQLRTIDPPSARSGSLCVLYENMIYYFGGYTQKQGFYFNDLYRFNPETLEWKKISAIYSPMARVDHSLVQNKNLCYLFGGCDGQQRFNDLHELNLDTMEWRFIGVGPSTRFGHTSVMHNQAIIVFGGWNGENTLNDVWVFRDKSFRQMPTINPPAARYRHSSVLFKDSLYVFGGVAQDQARFNDLHTLNLQTYIWTRIQFDNQDKIPTSRSFHKCLLLGSYMYLIGGFDGQRRNDMYRVNLDFNAELPTNERQLENYHWTLIDSKDKFTPRTGHACCQSQGRIYIFGGVDDRGIINNDLHLFNGLNWQRINHVPYAIIARSGAKMVAIEDWIYIFGGYRRNEVMTESIYFNDLWRYSISKNQFQQIITHSSPQRRTDHSLVVSHGFLYLFGGVGENKSILGDLWKFGGEWKKIDTEYAISNRFGHIAISYQNSMYIFGGWDGSNCLADLYEFSYITGIVYEIRRCSGSKPNPRYRHEALIYNDCIYVFGGVDFQQNRYNDLHQFNIRLRQWSKIITYGQIPSPRTFHKFVNFNNRFYVIGGIDGNRLNDMHIIKVPETVKLTYQTVQEFSGDDQATNLKEQVRELASKLKKEEEKHVCKICFSRQIDSILMDCCHFILCFHCTETIKNCPVCRQKISRIVRTSMY